jgi:plasmid maintenance system antidote protein VapI
MNTRTKKPTPVEEMLKEEFLIPLGLTQRQFAKHLRLEVKAINRLVKGTSYLYHNM